MYVCEDCRAQFDDPLVYKERDTGYCSMTCPDCGSDDISELNNCSICGELTGDEVCPECMAEFARLVEDVIAAEVGAPPKDVLASHYEGFPQGGETCAYCDGGNCKSCRTVVEDAIANLREALGCTGEDVETMANQKYGWG